MGFGIAVVLTLLAAPVLSESPPTLVLAGTPRIPDAAVEGGEVRLEAQVDVQGAVQDVKVLRDTPPFTAGLVEAVKAWRFEASSGGAPQRPVRALVVGLFRAPGFGDQIAPGRDQAVAGRDVPLPRSTVVPPCPAGIVRNAVVVLEVEVSRAGRTANVRVVGGEAPFTDLAAQSVRRWTFRPAERAGQPASGRVWVVVGFRAPIVP